jgi:hypothetical protein
LRLLRSGLTEQNVAMLKQERPEIPFVSWICTLFVVAYIFCQVILRSSE